MSEANDGKPETDFNIYHKWIEQLAAMEPEMLAAQSQGELRQHLRAWVKRIIANTIGSTDLPYSPLYFPKGDAALGISHQAYGQFKKIKPDDKERPDAVFEVTLYRAWPNPSEPTRPIGAFVIRSSESTVHIDEFASGRAQEPTRSVELNQTDDSATTSPDQCELGGAALALVKAYYEFNPEIQDFIPFDI